jgi:CRISPR-associated protein Csx3
MIDALARGTTVAIGGPPHSGKSVFVGSLYQQLLNDDRSVFLQPACPDGEGMWSREADPTVVAKLRRKHAYTPEFVDWIKRSIPNLRRDKSCTLLDLGGLRSPPNEDFLRLSTHLIVVSGDQAEADAWRRYGEAQGCRILAMIVSRLFRTPQGALDTSRRTPDQPWRGEAPLHGEIWQLDRASPRQLYEGAVAAFAGWFWKQVGDVSN